MKHMHCGRLIVAVVHGMTIRSVCPIGCLLVVLGGFTSSFAQSEYEDVIYLTNGEVRRGMIIEEVPNVHVKIQTLDGNVFVYTIDEIERKTKEVKKARAAVAVIDASPRAPSDVKLEKWYTYWGLGYANPSYTESFENFMSCSHCDNFSMGLDLFGFYWPLQDQKTILGFVWNGSTDRYSYRGSWAQHISSQWSISGMHFIQSGIGKGPFVRTDIGYGIYSAANANGQILEGAKDSGVSLVVGGGYGLPMGAGGGTRILFNANLAFRPGVDGVSYDEDNYDYYTIRGKVRVFSLTAGFLF